MNNKQTNMLTRVNKIAAKNLWNVGIPLVCTSAGLNPEHAYTPMTFCTPDYDFDCLDSSYKKYAAYYVPTHITLHITFTDGSNPYLYYTENYKELAKELKRWKINFNVVKADYYNSIGNYKTYGIELILQPKHNTGWF